MNVSAKVDGQRVESADALQDMTPYIAGFLASLILWSFLFTPSAGNPFDAIMLKMLGPGPIGFAALGLMITAFIPSSWGVLSVVKALVTTSLLTGALWLS